MKVQLQTRVVHGRGFARKGEIIDVSPARGAQLIKRNFAIEVFPTTAPKPPSAPTQTEPPTSDPVAASDTREVRSGSPTGRAITSSSLAADQARPKRRYTKRKAAPE